MTALTRISHSSALLVFGAMVAPALLASPLAAQQQPDYAQGMRHEHAGETPTPSPAALIKPRTAVTGEMVTYGEVGGRSLKGYLAKPAVPGASMPAIVMVHEWWGLNDNIKAVADRYAGEGYTVLAVDLFGRVATTSDSAMVLYQTAMADIPRGEQNVSAAAGYLSVLGATSIGAVGYCFGGHWSLRTGLVGGAKVDAVVMYYGAPITDTKQLSRLKAPVLGLFAGLDRGIPADSVRAMETVMKATGHSVEINMYEDADHGFSNPSGQTYNATAAEDAWSRALAFFKMHLK